MEQQVVWRSLVVGCSLLVGSLLGTFLSLSSLLATFLSLNNDLSDQQPSNSQTDIFKYFPRFQSEIICLCFLNICFSIPLYSLLVFVIFPLLDKIFSDQWTQLLVAFSVALAVSRKQANISLLNLLLGGFDLETIPIIKDIVQSLITIYDNIYNSINYRIIKKAGEILTAEAKKIARENRENLRMIETKFPNNSQGIQSLTGEIEANIRYYQDHQRNEHQNELERITQENDPYPRLIQFFQKIRIDEDT